MRYRKLVSKQVHESTDGVTVAASINAVVAVNVNERGGRSRVSSKQRVRVIQRKGRTEIFESSFETKGETDARDE